MNKRSLRLLKTNLVLLFAVALMCYCSYNSQKNSSVTGTGKEIKSNSPKANANIIPHVYSVSISEMKFNPEKVVVHKGDTVIWINHDMVAHCVTEIGHKAWTSSEIPPGRSWKMVVTQGSKYLCSIHPVMKGEIVVK